MQIGRYAPIFLALVAGVAVGNYTFQPLLVEQVARRKDEEKDAPKPEPEQQKKTDAK